MRHIECVCWFGLLGALLEQAADAAEKKFVDYLDGRLVVGGAASPDCSFTGSNPGAQAQYLVNPVDIVSAPGGVIYVLDRDCSRVVQVSISGTVGGGAIVAGVSVNGNFLQHLFWPQALDYDAASGKLWIADTNNARILQWEPGQYRGELFVSGDPIWSPGKLNDPYGIVYWNGNIYVATRTGNRVQEFELSTCCADPTQAIATLAFGCPQEEAACTLGGYSTERLRAATRMVASESGQFYIADTGNHRVLRFNVNDTILMPGDDASNATITSEVVAGTTGIAGCRPEQLNGPSGLALDSLGYLYVADTGNHRIQKFAVMHNDRLGVTVAGECCCLKRDGSGNPVGGSALHQLNSPLGLDIDVSTGALLVVDSGNRRVLAFGGQGAESRTSPGASCAYGVDCTVRLFGEVTQVATNSQLVIVKRESYSNPADPGPSPCGSFNCTMAHWPGMTNPQVASGNFFDTFEMGMPDGPPSSSTSGLGEYALCWAESPSTPCVGYACTLEDNCTNSSSWLCSGAEPMGLVRKVWQGVPGPTVAELKVSPDFPDNPDSGEFVQGIESADNLGDQYGQQFYGLFVAPMSGTYTFYITSDENSEIRISDEFNNTDGLPVAYISETSVWYAGLFPKYGFAQGPDYWDTFPTQTGTYEMEAGQVYWLEVLHKENNGPDHLRTGVRLPNGTIYKPIPDAFFNGVVCDKDYPSGLAVVHDCVGRTTGQQCTARCSGGFTGEQQIYTCDGIGRFLGRSPTCRSVNCEEYNVEVGSLFMHGVWDKVDCTNMAGTLCTQQQLQQWAGPASCVARVATAGSTCEDYCHVHGRSCIKTTADLTSCSLAQPGQVWQTPSEGSCNAPLAEQICVCGRKEETTNAATCLIASWCDLGLMSPGGHALGAHSDDNDDLIVADTRRGAVVRWTGRRYETLAGGRGAGRGLDQLSGPTGVYFMPGSPGTLYIADTENHRVLEWPLGNVEGTVAFGTTGVLGDAMSLLRYPAGVYVNDSVMFVVDYGNSRVLQVPNGSSVGQRLTVEEAIELPIIPTTAADSFFDGLGNYYHVDYGSHRLTVCLRQAQCSFVNCKDANDAAVYGVGCGCFEDRSNCREALGVLE